MNIFTGPSKKVDTGFKTFLFLIIQLLGFSVKAQVDTSDLMQTTVSDLMKLPPRSNSGVEIISASKKAESIFDAPMAATVITKEELKAAGVTSIFEAMRLVPGLIVRETSNGNYETYIRGLEYALPNDIPVYSVNRTSLIMIDGRPVYNHLNGGTFWESFPIDVNDIERIEVIRGPSAPLYGPNAVSGVIHFITRKKQENKEVDIITNAQYGSFNSILFNSLLSYRLDEKLSLTVSGNYQRRGRTDNQYFDINERRYTDASSLNYGDFSQGFIFPDTTLALEKFGLNMYANYKVNKKIEFDLRTGTQQNQGHKIFEQSIVTNMTYIFAQTQYIDFITSIHGVKFQYNYLWGNVEQRTFTAPFNFNTHQASIEYDYEKISRLRISPLLSIRRVSYDEQEGDTLRPAYFSRGDKVATATNAGLSLRLDYNPVKELRIIGAIRAEYFDISDTTYLSYQLISTYKPTDKWLFRVSYGRSNAGNFIYDAFYVDEPAENNGFLAILGNRSMKLLIQDIFEIGLRTRLNERIFVDVEFFRSVAKNFNVLMADFDVQNSVDVLQPRNVPARMFQTGLTVSLEFTGKGLSFRPFVTYQKSRLKNYSAYYQTDFYDDQFNINNTQDTLHVATPNLFGGASILYQPTSKWSLHANPYFLGKSTYFYFRTSPDNPYVVTIPAQLLLNMKIGYQVSKKLQIFANARNLFSNNNYQHLNTDRIKASFFGGISVEL